MTPAETYTLAQTARSKLVSHADCKDPDLRLLTGHANMYDKLLTQISRETQERRQRQEAPIHHFKSSNRTSKPHERSKKVTSSANHPPTPPSPDSTKAPTRPSNDALITSSPKPLSPPRPKPLSIPIPNSARDILPDGDYCDNIDADDYSEESASDDDEEYVYMSTPIQTYYPPKPNVGASSKKIAKSVEKLKGGR